MKSREEILKYGKELINKLSSVKKGTSKITMDDGNSFLVISGTPEEIKKNLSKINKT
jgi:hypothetical protein